ncbi:CLOCK-interacting pacemaker-like [Acipenser oxyrinchus oxyrinchus]|uniref:CLOCK-interacting pacemaker-like n=1 Tax=Acipenser oxyrinchus oxyrinchus TaxID=40147 RepID=A0AAD8CGC6_ACIOX|nr:CLOCK-interacting pacemaker-like [Acipenser oxyrinchus oxyrinchus]
MCLSRVAPPSSGSSSEYLQMNSEDHHLPSSSSSSSSSSSVTRRSGGLTPVYIVKNLVIKQPLTLQTHTGPILHSQLAWGGQPALTTVSGQGAAQVLFIQQPRADAQLKPPRKKKDTYLPILNSYPRIAPHPMKSPDQRAGKPGKHGSLGGAHAGKSQSKRVCVADRREWVPSSKLHQKPERNLHQPSQQPLIPSESPDLCSLLSPCPTELPVSGPPSVSSSETSSSSASSLLTHPGESWRESKASSDLEKQHRFLNTVEILNRSGLLGITLRTKELIRQNHSTQHQIQDLREHVRLLCLAVRCNQPQDWARLQEAMVSSGYSDLTGELASTTAAAAASSPQPRGPAWDGGDPPLPATALHSSKQDPDPERISSSTHASLPSARRSW